MPASGTVRLARDNPVYHVPAGCYDPGMTDSPTLPATLPRPALMSRLEQLAAIPEEEVWLAKQKSRQTRRAYQLDVRHFMRSLGIAGAEALRQVDHRAVIAWERIQREQEGAAPSTVRRRLAALSSLFKHLVQCCARTQTG